jgi:hypothetical protein
VLNDLSNWPNAKRPMALGSSQDANDLVGGGVSRHLAQPKARPCVDSGALAQGLGRRGCV